MTLMRLFPALREALQQPVGAPPLLEPVGVSNGDLDWALHRIIDSRAEIYLFDRYYAGDHRMAWATEKWRTQFGRVLKSLNANYCPRVVDAMVDRLRLAGVNVSRRGNPEVDAQQAVIDAFRDNRFDRRAGMMHAWAARHGSAFLLIWPHPDTGRPAFYPHTADRMVVRYDDDRPGEIMFAAKIWIEDKHARVTLYYKDHVERWVTRNETRGGGLPMTYRSFEPFSGDELGPVYENPFGRVPVVPFVNNTIDGQEGRSELLDVIPLQDLLNKALSDMFVSMEFAGFPQRWATGLAGDTKDPVTGEDIYPFVSGVERMFTSDDAATRFGQFETADLAQFVAVQDSIRSDIARVSGTPLHYLLLTGDFPSGEALSVADAPMRAKIQDRVDEHGTSWEDVAMMVLLQRQMVTLDTIDQWAAEAVWRDTTPAGDAQRAEYAQLVVDLGASEAEGLRLVGYDEGQIEKLRAEREEEGTTAFDRGNADAGGLDAARAIADDQ